LDLDLIAIGFSVVFALGGIQILFSSFDDDDDDQNGGEGSPLLQASYIATPA